MYLAHFGLTEAPFSITPDTRFLYLSERHRDALAHLLYGIGEGGGFVQLTGEVGTGKTTLCRRFLEQAPAHVDMALILNPRLTGPELLAAVCDELRVPYPPAASTKLLVDALYRHLLDAHARGRRTVLVIDEAQDLAPDVLEDVRLLTNLETLREKLLQIILIGQPELARMLDREDLRQVAQRITARYHLMPFTTWETGAYIQHRLGVAGVKRLIFDDRAMREAHRVSGGVPRLINIVCDRALLGAYAQDLHAVNRRVVRRAAREALAGNRARRARPWLWVSAAASVAAVVAGAWVTTRPERPAWMPAALSSVGPAGRSEPAAVAPAALAPAPAGTGDPGARVPDARVASAATRGAASANGSAGEPGPSVRRSARGGTAPVDGILQTEPRAAASLTLAESLADPSLPSDKRAAFGTLYALWGLSSDRARGELGCEYGRRHGLRCLSKTGNWTRLRRFDLPAILELATQGGERRYAALVALGDDAGTLLFGTRRLTVPLAELDSRWSGSFIVLWKPPTLAGTALVPGARGSDVAWLRQRLDEVGEPPSPQADAGDVYDDALRARVAAFQRRHALVADGVVGDETLVRLVMSADDPPTPRLGARVAEVTPRARAGSSATATD
jgi:general secretion pathway protein A